MQTLTSTICTLFYQKTALHAEGVLSRHWHAVQGEAGPNEPSSCFCAAQEPWAACNAAEMRQLLAEEQLAQGVLIGFSERDLKVLVDKGLRTPVALCTADVAMLREPPALPEALIRLLLAKFNPDGLTPCTGEQPGWHCVEPQSWGHPAMSRREALSMFCRDCSGLPCKQVWSGSSYQGPWFVVALIAEPTGECCWRRPSTCSSRGEEDEPPAGVGVTRGSACWPGLQRSSACMWQASTVSPGRPSSGYCNKCPIDARALR